MRPSGPGPATGPRSPHSARGSRSCSSSTSSTGPRPERARWSSCALYLAAGVATTWPAVRDAGSSFLAGGASGHGEAAPGDHLQTAYHLWLVGHQLEQGREPWLDPYSFRPESSPALNLQGWPFG